MENEKVTKTKPAIIKNIFSVGFSNVVVMLSSVLVGFLVPKMMSLYDYGYYKIFSLYLGYIGVFHLGFCDGIYILYGGEKYENLDKRKFRAYSKFYILFQLFMTALIIFISLFLNEHEYKYIFIFVGVSVFATNITTYYQFISQITGRFKELSIRNIIKSILSIIVIINLFILFKTNMINNLEYKIYILIVSIINVILAGWYIFTYKNITFGKSFAINNCKKEIIELFKIGIPLLISNLVVTAIMLIDRQFVSALFSKEEYAIYAFAYSLLAFITTAISAISTVLYPMIKTSKHDFLKNNYNSFICVISIFISICLLSYYPLALIVRAFLPNYVGSIVFLRILLPGLIYSTCNSVIIYNYYKAMGMTKKYFKVSIIIFLITIFFNIAAYVVFGTMESISFASVIVFFLWFLLLENALVRKWNIKTNLNNIYILSIVTIFYLSTMISNLLISFIVYILLMILAIFCFEYKLIKKLLLYIRKNKHI